MRTIKLVVDTGKPLVIEAPEELSLGGLIEILNEKGVDFNLEKNFFTELKSKAIFATSDAILPEGDVRLFSTVKDPKGNSARTEAYAKVKAFISRDGDKAANHFNKDKNFTNKSTDDLEKLISKYESKNAGVTTVKAPKAAAKASSKSTTKKKSEVSVDDDPDFKELKAAQKSFNPKLTRR